MMLRRRLIVDLLALAQLAMVVFVGPHTAPTQLSKSPTRDVISEYPIDLGGHDSLTATFGCLA